MSVPKEAIIELQTIHQRQTGESLTDDEAQAMAADLFRLFLALYEAIPERWLDELNYPTTGHAHNQ